MTNKELIEHCVAFDDCHRCPYAEICDHWSQRNEDLPCEHMRYIEELPDEFLNADVNDESVSSFEDMFEVEMTESEYYEYMKWKGLML